MLAHRPFASQSLTFFLSNRRRHYEPDGDDVNGKPGRGHDGKPGRRRDMDTRTRRQAGQTTQHGHKDATASRVASRQGHKDVTASRA